MGFWTQRKVAVPGGAGFIGSNLVNRLLELGARVRVIDTLDRARGSAAVLGAWQGRVEFLHHDLRDPEACRLACRGCEVVFHFAARAGSLGFYQRHAGRVLTDNLLLDAQLLSAALTEGVGIYFYPSSSMVYPLERQQTPDAPALREEDALPANPPNSYGWAKLIGERAVAHAATENKGFRTAILRLENVYGPGQDIDLERGSVIPVLIRRAIEYPRVRFELRGTGQETRCYCYASDAVDAILRSVEALDRESLVGPLNATGPERVRIRELAEEILRLSGKAIEIELVPGETRIWGQVLDCSRARRTLGWEPQVSLREGLRLSYADVESRLEALAAANSPTA
jgi:GDP-D-mannose 3',5'-epimerase